jgi:predicted HTH transcriptional regulator
VNNYIKNLIRQGENQQLDFKFEISDSKKIARTFAAFANSDGGTLLIGVKDNGNISGIRTDEEVYMVESAAHLFCKPPVAYEIKDWEVDGHTILEVIVPKSRKRPHYATGKDNRWMVYIRVNDQNLLANRILLDVWKKKNSKTGTLVKYSTKEKLLLHYLSDNQKISFSKFRKIAHINNFIAEKILVNLISIGVLEIEFTEKATYYRINENYAGTNLKDTESLSSL